MAWYKRGTITLTQGSAAVTGTDAMFTAGIMEGSGIVVAGQYLAGVLSVEDNDHLTLSKPWPHATMTAVAYEAYPTESRAARQLDLTADLIDSFSPLRGSAQDFKDKIADRADEVAANQADVAAKLIQTIAARDAALTAEINAETAQVASEAARDVAITKRDEAVAARDASIAAKTASETARDASITAKTASETAKTASETARDASIAAKTASETAKTASETARNASQTAQAASELARDGSVTAKTASEAARDVASTKRDEAVAAKTASEAARDIAITKRDEAGTFRNQAEAEKLAAQTARTGAETAEDNAALSAADAAQSATDAQTAQTGAEAARDVSVGAKTASEGARDASVAAKVASEGARDTAITNRNEAIGAKTAAETARDVAISNRNDAVSAAVDAAGSAGDAAGSASSAADSAAAAAASALEASQFDATLYPKLAQDNVFSGSMTVPYLTVAAGAGSEGGEVKLKKGSGQGLDGDLIVDTAGDSFRVFDQTTPTRMLDYNLVAGHLSINGQSVYHTGNKPSKADVGLGSVSNLAPADMPISTATQNALNGKQASLGFTPVQQGTGVGQNGNTIKIGWNGTKLKATVDTTDQGSFAMEAGAAFTGAVSIDAGGGTAGTVKVLTVKNGAYENYFVPRLSVGSFNPIVQANDSGLIFTTGTVENGALVIAPWSANSCGVRISKDRSTFYGEVGITAAGNQLLLKRDGGSNVTAMHRNDGSTYYILLSDASTGEPNGTWNALRPFQINLANGAVQMSNGVTVNNGFTVTQGSWLYNGVNAYNGLTVQSGGLTVNGDGETFVIQGSSQYQGQSIRNNYANATRAGYSFLDFKNENGIPTSGIQGAHNTDGSGNLTVHATPAGGRTADRRQHVATFGSSRMTSYRAITIDGGTAMGNNGIAGGSNAGDLEIKGNGTGAAAMTFHRPGSYAVYFGLDTDNKLKIGGWSIGAVAHEIWHAGTFNPGNKVDKVSGSRPGVTKLYRRENDSGFSVQNHWTGSYWQLRGYNADDTFHAECYVERSGSAGYADSAGRAYPRRSDGGDLNFYWSGQGGQPTWLWGGGDGANMYVYNPSNFSVNYANSAGNSDTVDGVHGWQLAPKSAFLCAGVATYAGGVVTRRSDKNVSSITRLGLGRFQVNVANALPGYYVVLAKGDESVLQMSAQSYNRGTGSFALAFTHISDTPDPADPPIFDFVVLDAGLLA